MFVTINESGIAPSHSRTKRYADEYRFKCSCGFRSGAHPFRYMVRRSAEWHEIAGRGVCRTTIQHR